MTVALPPQSVDDERIVLGAPLIGTNGARLVATLASDEQLRPQHFYRESHGHIYTAMLNLADRGDPVDAATVCAELDRAGRLGDSTGRAYVHALPNLVPAAGNAPHYARRVVELARQREIQEIARDLAAAAQTGDQDAVAEAERRLVTRGGTRRGRTRQQRKEQLVDHVEKGEAAPWRWPFRDLNELTGGLWQGHLTVLIGHSGHGKSVLADQILEGPAFNGAKCAAYLTEMSDLERDMRFVARHAGIPLRLIRDAKIPPDSMPRFAQWVDRLPFEIVPVGQMGPLDLARDIRRRGWDICVIDLFNVVTGREVKDIDHNVGMFASLANDTGTHIVGCQHLNRAGFTSGQAYPPEPTVAQIRGSGAIHDLATNVLSVYLKEGEHADGGPAGEPGDEGLIRFIKLKNGQRGGMSVTFNGNRMRFLPPVEPGTVGAAA